MEIDGYGTGCSLVTAYGILFTVLFCVCTCERFVNRLESIRAFIIVI